MKKIIIILSFALIALRAFAVGPAPYTEPVIFSAIANGATAGNCTLTVYDESGSPHLSCGITGTESPIGVALLRPGKQYTVAFSATITNFSGTPYLNYNIRFVRPEGYSIFLNGVEVDKVGKYSTNPISTNPGYSINDTYTLELRPLSNTSPAQIGSFSGIDLGRSVAWTVGLGGLRTGRSAGRISFREKDLTNSPATRDRLFYTAPTNEGQISVVYDGAANQTLRQINVPQAIVNLVDDPTNGGYNIDFYTHAQATGSGPLYTFPGQTPQRTIHVQSPGANQLKITETEGSVSRVTYLSLTSGSVASGTFVWTLQEGDSSSWLRTTTHTSNNKGGTPTTRDDIVTVSGPDTKLIDAKSKYHYVTQPWGAESVTQTIADPDGVALTTTYVYNTDSSKPGNYTKIQSVTEPTKRWSSYLYYDDWNRRGGVKVESHPYGDSPDTAVPADPSVGYSISYDYSADYSGLWGNECSRISTINGITTGKHVSTYSQDTSGIQLGYTSTVGQTNDYANASLLLPAVITVINPTENHPDLYSQPVNVQRADRTCDVYDYCWANSNGSRFLTDFKVTGRTDYFETIIYHGTNAATLTSDLRPVGMNSLYSIYLPAYKATVDVIIRDATGLTVRKETWAHKGNGAYALLSCADYVYDWAGRLTEDKPNNGGDNVHNTYTNGQLTTSVDASGIETSFSYDGLGRVQTSTKKGVSSSGSYAAQSDVTTIYSYDAENHVTQTTVTDGTLTTAGTLTVTDTAKYDLAGRLEKQIQFKNSKNELPTTYYYDPSTGGRIVTVTLPNNGTKTIDSYLDGQPKSITGTAVVSEYFSYLVDAAGTRSTIHRLASTSSPAKTTTILDWLSRKISCTLPALDGPNKTATTASQSWSYNSYGQLSTFSQTGMADTLFNYDTMGQLNRSGLGTGTLNLASDRILDTDTRVSSSDGSLVTTTSVYASSISSSATVFSTQYQKLNLPKDGTLSYTDSRDRFGKKTVTTVAASGKITTSDTTVPGSTSHIIKTFYNGLLVSAQDSNGITMTYGYDAIGRQNSVTDPRTGTTATTTTYIDGTNLVSTVTDPASVTQATYGYDSAGRVNYVKDAFEKISRCDYNERDQVLHEWGDTKYPVEHVYDANYGWQTQLKTYASKGSSLSGSSTTWSDPGSPAFTLWQYDESTGLLTSKYDAANLDATGTPSGANCVSYKYYPSGQVYERTGQRGIKTTYTYDSSTGELTKVSYSDKTPALGFHYNRLGKLDTATDAAGQRIFNYNLTGTLELQSEDLPAYFNARRLTYKSDTSAAATTANAKGRYNGYSVGTAPVGTAPAPTPDLNVSYVYQADGRLASVFAAGQAFTYDYTTPSAINTNLVYKITNGTYTITNGTYVITKGSYTDTRGYDSKHDWTTSRQTTWGSTTDASFVYQPDTMGRTQKVTKTGALFSLYGDGIDGLVTSYTYDSLSQLTGEKTTVGTSSSGSRTSVLPGRDNGDSLAPGFSYDSLGNRTGTVHNGNTTSYAVNALNQYISRSTSASAFDVTGAATANATVTVNGSSTGVARSGNYFFDAVALNNSSTIPAYSNNVTVSDGSTPRNVSAYLPAQTLDLSQAYDADGNLTYDGRWNLTYDAENRLISCETSDAAAKAGAPRQKIEFAYDYMGRRIQKTVSISWNAATSKYGAATSDTRFLYDGWNLIAEQDALASFAIVRSYTWGLDLSGTSQGAGGVGGLLMIQDSSNNSYLTVYDAMGNLHGLIDASGNIVAAYEYDAFGQTLRKSGSFAAFNPFGYSTKYTDSETGFVYYGNRYYSPSLGRFINRDPIEEGGGVNLYGFCGNNGVNEYDYLGMSWLSKTLHVIGKAWDDTRKALQRACNSGNKPIDKGIHWTEEHTNTHINIEGGGYSWNQNGRGSLTDTHGNTFDSPSNNSSPVDLGGGNLFNPTTGQIYSSNPNGSHGYIGVVGYSGLRAGSQESSSWDAPNSGGNYWTGQYWSDVGDVFKGYGDAGVGTVTGLWQVVRHPIDTGSNLYTAATHPVLAYNAISNSFSTTWNSGNRGKGRIVGDALITVATIGAGYAKGIQAAGSAARGLEFSHWIPARAGGIRSIFNGNYVSTATHALSDPFRYRFMSRAFKAANPMPGVLSQQWTRLPNVLIGTAAGAAVTGASHVGQLSDIDPDSDDGQ